MEDQRLADIAKRLGVLGEKARRRQESYLNSPIADMPHWDRIMIEYFIEQDDRLTEIEKELAEIKEMFVPASEYEEEG